MPKINPKITIKVVRHTIFIAIVLFAMTAQAQRNPNAAFHKLEFTQGENRLPYRLLEPENPKSGQAYPLVIFLHGAGERGLDNEINLNYIARPFLDADNRKKFPAYLLVPQCPPNGWWSSHTNIKSEVVMQLNPSPAMSMLIDLLDEIEDRYAVDTTRIYVMGLSMGGYGTWELIARFPNRFAAAVPICGGGDVTTAPRIAHMPIWAFHGTLDRVVLPRQSRVMIEALRTAGAQPGYTEYPEVGHDSWNYAFRDPYLLPWMFRQHLPAPVQPTN